MKFGKIFKRTLSMLTATAIFCSLSIPAFAQSPSSDENGEYVVTYRAEPVTDIDALVALAAQQPKAASSEEEDDGLLRVKQLTEVREYVDGVIEKDYAESAISIGKVSDVPDSQTKRDNHVANYNVSFSFYYTIRATGNVGTMRFTFHPDKTVTNIVKTAVTNNNIVSGRQTYVCNSDDHAEQILPYNNATGSQTFTLHGRHSGFFESHYESFKAGLTYGVGAECVLDFSNGEDITIQIVATPYK